MSPGALGASIAIAGLPVIAGFFLFVSWILAVVSGWRHLATRFAAPGEFIGETFGFASGRLGWVNYNNCLTVGASRDGIFLSVIFPFSVVSPPLFLPWASLRARSIRLVFRDFVEFEVSDAAGVQGRFALKRSLAEDLTRASFGRFSLDG